LTTHVYNFVLGYAASFLKFLSIRCTSGFHAIMASTSDEFICSHCHRVSDEMTCSYCEIPTRKKKPFKWCKMHRDDPSMIQLYSKQARSKHAHTGKKRLRVSLVQGNKNYAHFSYREMEQEISDFALLGKVSKKRQSRVSKLEKTTSCPRSEKQSFNSSLEHKAVDFRNFV